MKSSTTLANWWKTATGLAERGRLRNLYTLTLSLLIGAFLYSTWNELRSSGWRPDYLLFGSSLLLVSLVVLTLPFWWIFSLRLLGARIPFVTGMRIWVLAQLAKYLPGGIWNYASRLYACTQIGLSKRVVVLSLGLETMLRIQAAIIVFLLSLPFWPVGRYLSVTLLSIVGVMTVGVLSLHPRFLEWAMNWLLRILRRPPMHIPSLGYLAMLELLVGHTLTVSGVGGAFYLMIGSVYRLPVNVITPITGMLAVSVISGFLNPITPHGLVTREGMLVVLLNCYLPLPTATMVALLSRLWLTMAELLGVVLVLIVSWGTKHHKAHLQKP